MDAYEQVAQMGNEPADVDAVLIKRDAVGLLDDGQHLLDDAGHLVCVGQVAVREAGVDQMQRQCHGLAAGQDTVQVTVESLTSREACAYSDAYSDWTSACSGYAMLTWRCASAPHR